MARSLDMNAEVAAGKSQRQIAAEHGISRRAVQNVLARVDGAIAEMAQEDLDLISDLMREADSHRKNGLLPPSWFDRVHSLLETRIKLRGTAAPSKHLHATVKGIDPEVGGMYVEFNKRVGRKRKSWAGIVAFIESCPDATEEERKLCLNP